MATESTHVNGVNTNGTANGIPPKITFYTNDLCPWAHRAAIALKALNLPYEKVIIPLDRPRDQWYLDINPRGLVPALKISNGILSDETITESAVVATFLADAFPNSSFYPKSHESPTSALTRARIAFFVDTFISKINGAYFYPILKAEGEEQDRLAKGVVETVEKEIEPLLKGAAPFFGGSESITLAEALTAPFLLRFITFSEAGVTPPTIAKSLKSLPNFGKWYAAVSVQESVTYVYDPHTLTEKIKERVAGLKAQGK